MKKIKIYEIGDVQTGPFGSQLHKSEYVKIGVPMLNSKNIEDGKIKIDSVEYISRETCRKLSKYILKKGDLIFGRAGSINKHAYIDKKYDGAFQGTNCIRIRCKNKSISKWLFYYFQGKALKASIENNSSGSVQSYITSDILKNMQIEIPNYEYQNKIVSILGDIDKKIVNNNEINNNLYHYSSMVA